MASSALDRDRDEIPALAPTTGPALGADAALRALEDNRPVEDEGSDSSGDAALSPAAAPGGTAAPARPDDSPGRAPADSRGPGERQARPPKKGAADKGEKAPADPGRARQAKARKLKRDELEQLYLAEADRADELRGALIAAERKAAVHQVVSNELVSEATDDLVGLLVDGLEAGAQLLVKPKYAPVIALEDDEREQLVRLGARYTRAEFPRVVEQSPAWALVAGVAAVVAGKLVALRLAQAEEREREPGA